MSASLETLCEQIIQAVLQADGSLAGFSIVRKDEDAAANKDRIVINAGTREVETYGKNQQEVFAYRVICKVEFYYVTRSEAVMDADVAALESAMLPAAFPATALAFITPNFSRVTIEQTSDGDDATDSNTRTRTRSFRCIVIPL